MESRELQRSDEAFKLETRWILGGALATALLAAIMVRLFMRMAFEVYLLSGFLTFLAIMCLAWGAVIIRSKKWDNTHYVLGSDALMITRPNGLFGTNQDVFLYESIISARVRQSYFGKARRYGDIELTIPKLEKQLLLTKVFSPEKQLQLLKAHMEHKGNRSRELVT